MQKSRSRKTQMNERKSSYSQVSKKMSIKNPTPKNAAFYSPHGVNLQKHKVLNQHIRIAPYNS